MKKKYTNTPLNIVEHRWHISRITTPVIDKQVTSGDAIFECVNNDKQVYKIRTSKLQL